MRVRVFTDSGMHGEMKVPKEVVYLKNLVSGIDDISNGKITSNSLALDSVGYFIKMDDGHYINTRKITAIVLIKEEK